MCTLGRKTQELVALAQGGDKSALNQLYRAYSERVRWMVRFIMSKELRAKFESMDLVQDALIHVLQGLGGFTYKNEGDFVRWLSKIAQNVLHDNLDKLRADKRDIRREVALGGYGLTTGGRSLAPLMPVDHTTPSVIMSKREDLAKLENALDVLKPEYRDVIVLTKIEGLSYREIGDRLGKNADAVRMLVSRAMAALTTAFRKL